MFYLRHDKTKTGFKCASYSWILARVDAYHQVQESMAKHSLSLCTSERCVQTCKVIANVLLCLFVCVEVLRPSQPNGVMSSAVSLPNHTLLCRLRSLSG